MKKQTKTVYAVVWTKKGAEIHSKRVEGGICQQRFPNVDEYITVDIPFFVDEGEAIKISNQVGDGVKVVKMEITYKEI